MDDDLVLKILHSKETKERAERLILEEIEQRQKRIDREQSKIDRYNEEKRREPDKEVIIHGSYYRYQFEGRESQRIIDEETKHIKKLKEAIQRL